MKPSILRQSPLARRALRAASTPRSTAICCAKLATSFLAASVILLLVMVGGAVADLLAKIARGRIPADLLFTLIGLRAVDALTILMPLAVLLGVLLAYGRLWRDSEMAVLQSSGPRSRRPAAAVAAVRVPAMIVLGAISFWLAPAAERHVADAAAGGQPLADHGRPRAGPLRRTARPATA